MGSSCIGTSEVVYTEVELTEIIVLPALRQVRTDFYFGVILPSVAYGMLVWGSCGQVLFSKPTILVTNLETLLWFSTSPMLIWVLQSSHGSKIRVAQHWGRRGANLSENEGVRSECKKFGENSRQMAPVSTICDEYCRIYSCQSGKSNI